MSGALPLPTRVVLAAAWAAAAFTPTQAGAQGTWMQTQCLVGAATAGPCKASPAWGQTGVEHVQALAAAAGPGNLGLSLVKPETLPAANAARAQLAAVMLAYLDPNRAGPDYRWFGPVARLAATPAAPATPPATAAPAAAILQAAWLGGALGDEPQARSASWWLAGPYRGASTPAQVDVAADPYRVLRFLAEKCPQLQGKVAPNAWTRCTTYNVPEPATGALAALALLMVAALRRFTAR